MLNEKLFVYKGSAFNISYLPHKSPCLGAVAYHMTAVGFISPDSKVHGANMGPIWGRQDRSGPHVGPMNFAIWVLTTVKQASVKNETRA